MCDARPEDSFDDALSSALELGQLEVAALASVVQRATSAYNQAGVKLAKNGDSGDLLSEFAELRRRYQKAAALFDSLINYRALIDGNKRLAWVAMRLFYGYNGHTITGTEDERFDFVLAVATGQLAGVPKVAEQLAAMATRV